MNRKLLPPLTKKMILILAELCELNTPRPEGINILEFSIGQLYQRGILRIKKQVENGVFIFIISITDAGKELLEKSEFSMQPAY
jgi:hypothetical protein